jgi:hypothetical protein
MVIFSVTGMSMPPADEEIKRVVTRGLAMRHRPTLVVAFWQQAEIFSV